MNTEGLTSEEKRTLLQLAREALRSAVCGQPASPVDPARLTPRLRAPGAAFVTLTSGGQLRGCVGALDPYQPLFEDVREHAAAAGLQDFRFAPVRPEELERIRIEVSCLSDSQPLEYSSPEDLLTKLCPPVDGVILRDGTRRATFLPQVWHKLPDPADFLDNLCYKMGAEAGLWRKRPLEVRVYRVEEFAEAERLN
jgi:AmmeMemoRadiSam system protein A